MALKSRTVARRAISYLQAAPALALAVQLLLLTLADLNRFAGALVFSLCAVLVSVLLRQPLFFLMVLSVFFTTNLNPLSSSGFEIRLWYVLLAAGLCSEIIKKTGRRRIQRLFQPQAVTAAGLLALVVLFSFVGAPQLDLDLAMSGVVTLSLSILGLLAGWLWFQRSSQTERSEGLRIFIFVPALLTCSWVLDKTFGLGLNPKGGLSYPLYKENQLAVAILVGIIILLLSRGHGLVRFGALALLLAAGMSATGSRAVLVMVALLIPLFLITGRLVSDKVILKNAAWLAVAFPAGLGLSLLFAHHSSVNSSASHRPATTVIDKGWAAGESNSFGPQNIRFEAWREGWDAFLTNPITGVGLRQSDAYVESLGHLHNSWLTLIVETGLLGLAFVLFLAHILARKLIRNAEPHHQKILVAAMLPIALVLGGYNFWDFQILWIIAGIALAKIDKKVSRSE